MALPKIVHGEAFNMPGFCFNRLTDFRCYVWVINAPSIPDYSLEDLYAVTDVGFADWSDLGNATWGNDTLPYYTDVGDWAQSFQKKDALYVYVCPLLLIVGTIGNLFSLVVLSRLSRHVFSSCIYLALLAAVDLVILYVKCGNDWLKNVFQLDLTNMLMVTSQSLCQVYPFCFNFIFHLSRWLMVCLAIEGYIATKRPERVLHLCTLSRAKAVVLLLTVLLICINIHYFWSFKLRELKEQHNGLFCTFAEHGHQYSEGFQEIIWPIMDLLIAEVLPCCVVIVCGAVMFFQIVTGRFRGRKSHQEWRERYQLNPAAMDDLKITILVICLLFLPLTLPKFAYLVFRYIAEKHDVIDVYSFDFEQQQMLVHAVCSMLEYSFHSCKFLVYLATSRMIRHEFGKLLRQFFCWCREQLRTPAEMDKHRRARCSNREPLIMT